MKSLSILSGKCRKSSGTAVCLDKVIGKYIPFTNIKRNCKVYLKHNSVSNLIEADLDRVIEMIIEAVNSCILHDSEIIIETVENPAENKILVAVKCINGHHHVNLTFDRFIGIPKDVISDNPFSDVLPIVEAAVFSLVRSGVVSHCRKSANNRDRYLFTLYCTAKNAR